MRIVDNLRVEIECACGAKAMYSIAEAYGHGRVTCPKCSARTNLDPEQGKLLQDHVLAAAEKIRRRFRTGEPEE